MEGFVASELIRKQKQYHLDNIHSRKGQNMFASSFGANMVLFTYIVLCYSCLYDGC